MMRRKKNIKAQEPSLVPLADMLTNTVGIVLFILAFTLLGTGGASVAKQLPMEQETDAKPILFLCLEDRILPVDFTETERLPQPRSMPMDIDDARDFIRRGDGAKVENEFFEIHQSVQLIYENGQPSELRAHAEYSPKPNVGILKKDLMRDDLVFIAALNANKTSEKFLYFIVRPNAMDMFFKAREVGARRGFRSGWNPLGPTRNVIAEIIGRGGTVPKPDNK